MVITLPLPDTEGTRSLASCIRNRRSIRKYSEAPIPLPHVSSLLWAAQGITGPDRRTTPSAGSLYPLHVRVLARRVEALETGLYEYRSDSHSLEYIDSLPSSEAVQAAGIGNQPWLAESALVIGIAANLAGPVQHFEAQPPVGERGMRYVYMEAGALTQNVHLHATELELGCVLIGGFDDGQARDILGLPLALQPVALLCVGRGD